jgi:hypothetical protein
MMWGVIEFQVIFHEKFDKIQKVSFLRKIKFTQPYVFCQTKLQLTTVQTMLVFTMFKGNSQKLKSMITAQ